MPELQKVLSYKMIMLIIITSIMGTGIFFQPALGAKISGPMSILAWIILSIFSIYMAMIFGELVSLYPKSGGIYEFCKQAYGRFISFLVGWSALITANLAIAMGAVGAIQYLLPMENPALNSLKLGISLLFILLLNFIAYRGIKISGFVLSALGIVCVATIVILIIPGLFSINLANFTPFIQTAKPMLPIFALFATMFAVIETFFGWETATYLAEETKDGEKVIPKALIYGTIIMGILCILFVFVAIGQMGATNLGNSVSPISDLAKLHFGESGTKIFTILVYLSLLGAVASFIVGTPRLMQAMAEDKLFLSQFEKIHPIYNTPYKAIIFQTIISILLVLAATASYSTLLKLLIPIDTFIYIAVVLSLVILRYKHPNAKRHFKAPFGKIGPLLITIFCLSMIFIWLRSGTESIKIFYLGLSFIGVGIPLYFLIELYYNPKMIRKINDFFARLSLYSENMTIPNSIKKEIFLLIGSIRGKTVLEFGCNDGALTGHIAQEVGKEGKVYATNISEQQLKITEERLRKRKQKHGDILSDVELIYDIEHTSRVHPMISYIDAAISVGMLSCLTDINKILHELNELMPEHGRICFVEYVNYYKVLPDVEWLSDFNLIKQIFKEAGFSVHVKKKHFLFWNYLFIYGMKTKEDIVFI